MIDLEDYRTGAVLVIDPNDIESVTALNPKADPPVKVTLHTRAGHTHTLILSAADEKNLAQAVMSRRPTPLT